MRILILNPPASDGASYIREGRCMQSRSSWTELFPPITLMYLSSSLRERGFDVQLVDAVAQGIAWQQALDLLQSRAPELLVLNTAFPSIRSDMDFARQARELVPDLRTVAVGVFPTLLPREGMQAFPWLSHAVVGEPERAVVALAESLAAGGTGAGLPSLAWREEGQIRVSEERDLVEDLDSLSFPDRDSIPSDLFRFPLTGEPLTMISLSRGCPHSCIYCLAPLYYGRRERRRSAGNALAEIQECVRRHGIRHFIFWGEMVSSRRSVLMELCEALVREDLDICWMGAARADQLDDELLALMHRSGCYMLTLGLESSSQAILDGVHKGLKVEDGIQAAQAIRRAGIKVMGHFVVGLPGETEETARASRVFARRHCDYAQFYCAVPYPGTELAERGRLNGWLREADWTDYDFPRALLDLPGFPAERAEALRRRAFVEFYFRPEVVWANLRRMKLREAFKRLDFRNWMKG
ncbi:MAG: B12-binding domain-containing radical SAM protein [Candidatus Xenobium sp.]|jgi:anaerobic magnesium-protoporphyrin IX monomethyl ester cyclase|nr:radical SAM protein [Burkholderiales bacterium]